MKHNRILLISCSLVLILEFGARLLFPAQESESSGLSVLRLLFDCGMLLGVVGVSVQILKSTPRPIDVMGPWMALPALGLLAGLGLFVLRLSGGPSAELPPRPGQSRTESPPYLADLEELGKRAGAVMVSYQAADSTLGETRWAKTDSHERRQLSREALKEYIARMGDLVEATDQVIALLSEPGFAAKFTRFVGLAKARGERLPKVDLSPDAWLLLRRICAGGYQVHVLIEAHWEDWVANPFPEPAKASPWQKEVLALVNDIQMADKEHHALLEARGGGGASPKPTSKPTNAP